MKTLFAIITLLAAAVTARAQADAIAIVGVESYNWNYSLTTYADHGGIIFRDWKPNSRVNLLADGLTLVHDSTSYLHDDTNMFHTVQRTVYIRQAENGTRFYPVSATFNKVYMGTPDPELNTNNLVITQKLPLAGILPSQTGPTFVGNRVVVQNGFKRVEEGGITITFFNNVVNGPIVYRFHVVDSDGDQWTWDVRVEHGERAVVELNTRGAKRQSGHGVDWFQIQNVEIQRPTYFTGL